MGKDYYDILGVSKQADEAELKKGRFGHCNLSTSRTQGYNCMVDKLD